MPDEVDHAIVGDAVASALDENRGARKRRFGWRKKPKKETTPLTHCENCGAQLHGHYCAICGRSEERRVRKERRAGCAREREQEGQGGGEEQSYFFSSRRRHTRYIGDWSSDVCSSDLDRRRRSRFRARRKSRRSQATFRLAQEAEEGNNAAHALRKLRRAVARTLLRDLREIGRASCKERAEGWVRAGA